MDAPSIHPSIHETTPYYNGPYILGSSVLTLLQKINILTYRRKIWTTGLEPLEKWKEIGGFLRNGFDA